MYYYFYKYSLNSNILYKKQFGFQKGHSTDHAILQLEDQIHSTFEQSNFTLGVFIDLSTALNTVGHNIQLKKIEINGMVGKNLQWFENYLNTRKQYIQINNEEKTTLLLVKCGVPQVSILGPFLFLLIYINHLQFVSNGLDPKMFADDPDLFYSHKNINAVSESK